MQNKVMLIDGNSIINRAFYGVPLLTNAEGKYTNAVYGFLNIMLRLMDDENPDYIGVAFDLHAPTFRHIKYTEYKGTRKGMPEELREQVPMLKEVLKAMGIQQFELEGFEADDILGTLATQAAEAAVQPVIVSGDRDLLQLASDRIKIKIPKTYGGKTTVEDYYAEDVEKKYGVTPKEFIDLKALMGDASDNIPGVPGIGEKTAAKIIIQYHSIENAIEHAAEITPKRASNNLMEFKEQAELSKYLATIVLDVPVTLKLEDMKIQKELPQEAYELFKAYEFKSLIERYKGALAGQGEAIPNNYRKITTETECEAFCAALQKGVETAYILIAEEQAVKGAGFFSSSIEGVWIEASDVLTDEKIMSCLRDFFTDPAYLKIAHDAKQDSHILWRYDIDPSPVIFDTAIAGYVLNATRDTYEYNDIAGEFLEKIYPAPEEILGKGKSRISIVSVPEPKRTEFVVRQAQVAFEGKQAMAEKLAENNQQELYYEMELPLVYVLADMEKYGMKVDEKGLLAYQSQLEKSIEGLTEEIYNMAGEEFNLNSPMQLGVILFERLMLPGGKKTKTGNYSTGADILEKLKADHPIIEKILLYRQLSKLKSTYADGLLNVVDRKTHKIYSTFRQTITATGRISSTEPNLQNIPIRLELGRQLRKVFIPSSEDYLFLDADYSQIELRVLAHMSNDETLINAFQNGQDIHRLTASQVFGVPFEEVTSKQRSDAKAVNFGIVYGIGAFSLSQDLGITRKEAEKYIAGYFAKYPNIKIYMEKTIADARELGYVQTLFHRRRMMPELNAQNFVQRSFGERVAMNMPIQGSAADIIKIAMVKVHKSLKDRGLKSRLILQVHDELLIEVHKDEVEEVSALLKHDMETAVSLKAPMEVDVHLGENWFEAK